ERQKPNIGKVFSIRGGAGYPFPDGLIRPLSFKHKKGETMRLGVDIEFEVLKFCQRREKPCLSCGYCETGQVNRVENYTRKYQEEVDETIEQLMAKQNLTREGAVTKIMNGREVANNMSEIKVDETWVKAEIEKEEERQRQRESDKKAIRDFSEEARQVAEKIPDADLPSHVQLWDAVRKYDYKVEVATARLAQEELEREARVKPLSERAKIYG
ncbi:MAG: hypothetical protein Q8R31_06705, partial [Candidatus Omnitrophota bacterium]|nr:hypothetical protein [Candidatus Omnitrophota bacterium]